MVERNLVGGQAHLPTVLDDLQLYGDKLPTNPQGDEAVWDPQIYPGLNPGNKAVWEIFFQSVVQARLWLRRHLTFPRTLCFR